MPSVFRIQPRTRLSRFSPSWCTVVLQSRESRWGSFRLGTQVEVPGQGFQSLSGASTVLLHYNAATTPGGSNTFYCNPNLSPHRPICPHHYPYHVGGISCLSTFTQKPEVHNCPECLVRLHVNDIRWKWLIASLISIPHQAFNVKPSVSPPNASQHKTTYFFQYPLPISRKRNHHFWNNAKQKWLLFGSVIERMTKTQKWELPFTLLPPPETAMLEWV